LGLLLRPDGARGGGLAAAAASWRRQLSALLQQRDKCREIVGRGRHFGTGCRVEDVEVVLLASSRDERRARGQGREGAQEHSARTSVSPTAAQAAAGRGRRAWALMKKNICVIFIFWRWATNSAEEALALSASGQTTGRSTRPQCKRTNYGAKHSPSALNLTARSNK